MSNCDPPPALLPAPGAPRASSAASRAASGEPAVADPVAEVAVDVPLAHLDRPFEYTVPPALAAEARPGVRVKVRFAGQDVDGFILARKAVAEHAGRLAPLRRVVSPEPVLTPDLLGLAREVARDHVGTLQEVLRLAIPPRHARAEKALAPAPEPPDAPPPVPATGAGGGVEPGPWAAYPAGESFLRRVAAGQAPAAAWLARPGAPAGEGWPQALARAARVALDAGRGVVLVVPDHRDVARVDAALTVELGPGRHVRLTADQGPQARYTAWLKLLRGHVRCVIGARAAAFAPVADPGLLAWWDDGDDLHAEPRAPYPHVRDVLRLRAARCGAALLAGGLTRTAAVQAWVEAGWMRAIGLPASAARAEAATVRVAGEGTDVERDGPAARAHLPSAAWRAARAALDRGPVLVQVPRRGYLLALSCATCRARARCPACHGPLAAPGPNVPPACSWCGQVVLAFTCESCGGHRWRSSVVGAGRTAEELGRAFPGVPVRTSGGGEVIDEVADTPALVIATPGAEPVAPGGYAATLLLDAWASLERPSLDAGQEALRRWVGAAALTVGRADGGVVVLCGVPDHATLPAVEALVRWDPEWFSARELAERAELALPPAAFTARLSGPYGPLTHALGGLALPEGMEVIGPVPTATRPGGGDAAGGRGQAQEPAQALVRGPWGQAPAAREALSALRRRRSAQKTSPAILVRVGAADLGA